jgi:hypothetical protein
MLVVLLLAVLVPLYWYAIWGVREWASAGSPYHALTSRFFAVIALGRSVGAILLALLLLGWRQPGAIAVTLAAVWLAGPPVTFLWMGITVLAASAGQASWAGSALGWLPFAMLVPSLATILLLVPGSARRAYGL